MRRMILLALGLLAALATTAAAQKKPKAPPAPVQEPLKAELEAQRAEVTRLQEELARLQAALDAQLASSAEKDAAQATLADELRAQLAALEEQLSAASSQADELALARRAERLAVASSAKDAYRRHCASCHGARGDAKGVSAKYLDQVPRDFTRGTYKLRSTPSGSLPTRDDLARSIRVGLPGTSMPGWGDELSSQEINALAALIESFSPRFDEEPQGEEVILIPDAPTLTPALAREGRALFLALGCDNCHGTTGKGDGPSRALKDELGNPILATNFTRGLYKSGPDPRDLYRSIATGLDGSPMPAYYDAVGLDRAGLASAAKRFSGQDAKDILAYAASQPEDALDSQDPRAEQRRWALVAYIRSLAKPRSLLQKLLRDQLHRYF